MEGVSPQVSYMFFNYVPSYYSCFTLCSLSLSLSLSPYIYIYIYCLCLCLFMYMYSIRTY